MFREGSPIAYDAPADLKKWPSLNGQQLNLRRAHRNAAKRTSGLFHRPTNPTRGLAERARSSLGINAEHG